MLNGIMINTNGSVHGKTIIESPATYAIINHDGYENSLPDFTETSLVNEKIIPRKINENRTNAKMTPDFLANIVDNDLSISV
jgi:hypothetical protein